MYCLLNEKGRRMAVSLLDLAAYHEPLHKETMVAIKQVFHSQAYLLGPEMSKKE
jgi:hypothetical protein